MRRILLLGALVLASFNAQATITITSISGVSTSNIIASTTTTTPGTSTPNPAGGTASATAEGGVAGYLVDGATNSCSNPDGLAVCDSCPLAVCKDLGGTDLAPLCACNRARVYDALQVTVAVSQTGNPALYNVRAVVSSSTGTSGSDLNSYSQPINTGAVSFTWQTICNAISAGASCENLQSGSSVIISVYIDKDTSSSYTSGTDEKVDITFKVIRPDPLNENVFGDGASEGIGDFLPWPGDDRIYLKESNTTSTFPSLSYGAMVSSVKVFLSDVALDKATPTGRLDPEGSLTVSSGQTEPDQDYVDDVKNGTLYFVRLAMQDEAGNIVQFYPDINATDAKGVQHANDCNSTGTPSDLCPFAVRPDQVLGILSKDFNCFIASAAYGTSLEPKLNLFRKFRSDILLRHAWGRDFVWKYYVYGPYAARYISDKPILRAIVRGLLWPLAGFSWLALKVGLVKSLIVSLLLLSFTIAFSLIGLRRLNSRA